MNQKEYFNCSTYRKKKKKYCTSHQITAHAAMALIKNDVQYTIKFATENKETFMSILKERAKAKTQYDNINRFKAIVKRYSDFDEITSEILRAFVDRLLFTKK